MANHKKERVEQAINYLYIISKKIVNAEYTDMNKGMLLYLDDGNVFELSIKEGIHGVNVRNAR